MDISSDALKKIMSRKDPKIMKYVPKSKQGAIKYAYHDGDGYWIGLNDGWNADNMGNDCRTISQDTIKELRYQIAGISKTAER